MEIKENTIHMNVRFRLNTCSQGVHIEFLRFCILQMYHIKNPNKNIYEYIHLVHTYIYLYLVH